MFIRLVVIFTVFLVCPFSVECQVTQQNEPPDWFYVCSGDPILTCPYGFVLNIIEVRYGIISGECVAHTAENATKTCDVPVSDALANFQKMVCNNKTFCNIIQYSGYKPCLGTIDGTSNYGAIHYQCLFVGYEGMSSPPTTTTSSTRVTTVPTTTTLKTTTPTTPAPTTTSTTTKTSPSSMTAESPASTSKAVKSTTGSGTVNTQPQSSTQPSTTKRPAVAASALDEEEKTKLIIGVSVGAVVLILVIIVLVECKRQMRDRKNREARSAKMADEREMGIQPLSDAERAALTSGQVVYNDENSIIPVERERKFKKKSEMNKGYENIAEFSEPARSEPSSEQQTNHFNGHRDSGVSTLFAEEGGNEGADDSQGDKTGSDVMQDSPVSSNSDSPQRPDRHVSFSDMAMNTDMVAIDGHPGEPLYDRTTPVSPSHSAGNPALDPSVAGPVNENEVLY